MMTGLNDVSIFCDLQKVPSSRNSTTMVEASSFRSGSEKCVYFWSSKNVLR